MTTLAREPVHVVVQQHAEESALLRNVRSVLVRAPHVKLHQLGRLDERIAAHIDGLAVAGTAGTRWCTAALERPGVGECFACTVRAIDERDDKALGRMVALAAALPHARRGVLSAFGWVSAAELRGIVSTLLISTDAFRRALGIDACRLHGVDPGTPLVTALHDADASLRRVALRAAGDLGRIDALPQVLAALGDPGVATQAAVAACRLGDRADSLYAMESQLAAEDLPDDALGTLLMASSFARGRELVLRLARSGASRRRVLRACGLLGDAKYVPWFIELMHDDSLARAAGEAFSLVAGADIEELDLDRPDIPAVRNGPSEDPEDEDVSMDEDESLPWPDPARVTTWWLANASAMPVDAPCFMGAAPTVEHLWQVLEGRAQRQRIVAAWRLSLLQPGTHFFPVCAPAWRQRRRLVGR